MTGHWLRRGVAVCWFLGMGGLTPLWGQDAAASNDLETTISQLKKGTPIRLDLQNGKSIQGRFSTYDDYYGRVWLIPDQDDGTLLRTKSIRLSSIQRVQTLSVDFPPSLAGALLGAPRELETR